MFQLIFIYSRAGPIIFNLKNLTLKRYIYRNILLFLQWKSIPILKFFIQKKQSNS